MCPVSDGKNYLQVDLGSLYEIEYVGTFSDSSSRKWVSLYWLNYTADLDLLQWKKALTGNSEASFSKKTIRKL